MPLPYRTVIQLPAGTDSIRLAEQEVQAWLEARRKVEPKRRVGFTRGSFFEPGVHPLSAKSTLSIARSEHEQSGARSLLMRFMERSKSGTWQVDVVALGSSESTQGTDTLVVQAIRVDQPDASGQVDPPYLVKQLLAREDVRDGLTPVTPEPRFVSEGSVDEVRRAITDPARSVTVIVAVSPGREYEAKFRALVQQLTSKLVGVASVFVLSPDAARELNGHLPASHQVESGRVRTYFPDVDLEDPADGRRHRVLGPRTFARAIQGSRVATYLQEAFALQTRAALLASPLPRTLRRQVAALQAQLADFEREAAVEERVVKARRSETQSSIVRSSEGIVDRVRKLVERWLGRVDKVEAAHLDQIDRRLEVQDALVAALKAEVETVRERENVARDQLEIVRYELEYRQLELAESERETSKLTDLVSYLQRELVAAGRAAQAYAPSIETSWEVPADLSELALLLMEDSDHPVAKRVVFTGDPDKVAEADLRDQSGLYVQRCWEFIRALYDYAELKSCGDFSGNVHSYLTSPDHLGAKVPVTRHASSETRQTMDQWGAKRIFPVPADVDPSGRATMPAHFKAGQDNTFAPRLHYLDDVDRSGKVYVGYIGRHLTNKHTKNA